MVKGIHRRDAGDAEKIIESKYLLFFSFPQRPPLLCGEKML